MDRDIIRPTLHLFGVETKHLEEMVDWYSKVVGMTTTYSNTRGSDPSRLVVAALLSNDRAHHRMSILSPPELQEDTDKKAARKTPPCGL